MNQASPPHVAGVGLSGVTILRRLPPTARMLIGCRVARSIGQGALVTDFAL